MNQVYSWSPIKRFFKLLEVDRQDIVSIYVYAVFNGLVSLSLPLGIQAIINLIGSGQVSTSWIILVAFVIAGVAISGVMQVMQLSISENLQQKIFTRSAFEFAYRIPRLKPEAIDKSYIPELVNRFFDTLSVQKGLSKILIDFSSASLQVIFGLILLSLYHPFFILFSILLVIIVYLIFYFISPRGLRTSLAESKNKYEVAHWLEELARSMEAFKLAGKSNLPLERTDEVVSKYLTSRKAHFKTLLLQYVNMIGFKVLIAAGLLLIGGLLVLNQQMSIGQFVASEIIIILVLGSVEKLILSMETIYDVLTAIEKIGHVSDIPLESQAPSGIEHGNRKNLSIELKSLSFRFKDQQTNILDNINWQVKEGEKVCLSGKEGSGKSLLLQIMAGLYDSYTGLVSVNDIPLRNWNKEDLRSLIGDSLAKEIIFQGTLYENIALGKPDVTFHQVQEAVQVSGLSSFVESLEDGYRTLLVPEGQNLPKSIRLKIMLARCITGNPGLVLLEDHFNSLNKQDRERFLSYLLNSESTVIVVSNNPDVAARFSRISLLDQGHIIADDTYSKVSKTKEWTNISN